MKKTAKESPSSSPSSSLAPPPPSYLCSLSSPKLLIYLLSISGAIFILFQIQSMQLTPTPCALMHQRREKIVTNSCLSTPCHVSTQSEELIKNMSLKLRQSVTFLPLKDLRYADALTDGHKWFMSSMHDTHEKGQVQCQHFPSEASDGRLLCLRGRDRQDGARNSYALAWPEALPRNATLMSGITFVSHNHYDYDNIWHGLLVLMPFVAWHIKSRCASDPTRWILYHWGELRTDLAPWVRTLLEATFGRGPLKIEDFNDGDDDVATCFEEAVVMRRNEGGMSKEKIMEVYDVMRCRSRVYCGVESRGSDDGSRIIGMTILMRDGARSFKNASAVIRAFEAACGKVEGCHLMVVYPHNLTFCEQVKVMSSTDMLISAHGAQLTNMIFMDRNSSVMELFPKGWLEFAGVGQYVYHSLAAWSGMRHGGVWRDPAGDPSCPFPENDRRCMSAFKNGRIGHNETYFSQWAAKVLGEVKLRKAAAGASLNHVPGQCGCN